MFLAVWIQQRKTITCTTIDDGSCTFSCLDNEYVVTVDGGTWQGEVSWEL